MAILYERWEAAGENWNAMYGKRYSAQTFTVGNTGDNVSHLITSVKLYLRYFGTQVPLIVSIRAVDGAGLPTGPDLVSTSYTGPIPFECQPLIWVEITLPQYRLIRNTQYAIVVGAPAGSVGDIIDMSRSTDHGYGGGAWCYSTDWGVTWGQVVTRDFQFKIYGLYTRVKFGKGQNKPKLEGKRENKAKLFDEETNKNKIECERE